MPPSQARSGVSVGSLLVSESRTNLRSQAAEAQTATTPVKKSRKELFNGYEYEPHMHNIGSPVPRPRTNLIHEGYNYYGKQKYFVCMWCTKQSSYGEFHYDKPSYCKDCEARFLMIKSGPMGAAANPLSTPLPTVNPRKINKGNVVKNGKDEFDLADPQVSCVRRKKVMGDWGEDFGGRSLTPGPKTKRSASVLPPRTPSLFGREDGDYNISGKRAHPVVRPHSTTPGIVKGAGRLPPVNTNTPYDLKDHWFKDAQKRSPPPREISSPSRGVSRASPSRQRPRANTMNSGVASVDVGIPEYHYRPKSRHGNVEASLDNENEEQAEGGGNARLNEKEERASLSDWVARVSEGTQTKVPLSIDDMEEKDLVALEKEVDEAVQKEEARMKCLLPSPQMNAHLSLSHYSYGGGLHSKWDEKMKKQDVYVETLDPPDYGVAYTRKPPQPPRALPELADMSRNINHYQHGLGHDYNRHRKQTDFLDNYKYDPTCLSKDEHFDWTYHRQRDEWTIIREALARTEVMRRKGGGSKPADPK